MFARLRRNQIVTTFGPGAMGDLPDRLILISGPALVCRRVTFCRISDPKPSFWKNRDLSFGLCFNGGDLCSKLRGYEC